MKPTGFKHPRIFIDKEGNWFQDGIPILHRWTYLYNNSLLQKDESNRYYIDEGRGRVYVEVEDTPFVVKNIKLTNGNIILMLNDETEEIMMPDTLSINEHNIPYVKVKDGRFDARFCRAAYYEMMKVLKIQDDRYYLDAGGKKIFIKQK